MGSKNLKAVAVNGTKAVPMADEGAMRSIARDLAGRAMKNAAKIGAKVKAATIMIAVMPKALSMVSKVNLQQQSN